MFLEPRSNLLVVGLALALIACRGGSSEGADTDTGDAAGSSSDSDGDEGHAADSGDDGGTPTQAPSTRPRVKFKTAERYGADLSAALELPRASLCTELDDFDCIDVHRVALGEVDAFGLRLFEPLESTPLSAPIAIDRIGLSACGQRAQIDFEAPANAVTFAEVVQGDASEANRQAVVARLYRRLLLRDATDREVAVVASMFDELPAQDQLQTWAQMACFAIATSTEALFY